MNEEINKVFAQVVNMEMDYDNETIAVRKEASDLFPNTSKEYGVVGTWLDDIGQPTIQLIGFEEDDDSIEIVNGEIVMWNYTQRPYPKKAVVPEEDSPEAFGEFTEEDVMLGGNPGGSLGYVDIDAEDDDEFGVGTVIQTDSLGNVIGTVEEKQVIEYDENADGIMEIVEDPRVGETPQYISKYGMDGKLSDKPDGTNIVYNEGEDMYELNKLPAFQSFDGLTLSDEEGYLDIYLNNTGSTTLNIQFTGFNDAENNTPMLSIPVTPGNSFGEVLRINVASENGGITIASEGGTGAKATINNIRFFTKPLTNGTTDTINDNTSEVTYG